jgi:hypothetical protein
MAAGSSLQHYKEGVSMNKKKITLLILCVLCLLISTVCPAIEKKLPKEILEDKPDLHTLIYAKVSAVIEHADQVPGLKAEEFAKLKPQISNVWETLSKEQSLIMHGSDAQIRPYFVALQGIIEHVLASELQNSLSALKGIIHTPMPATPLCMEGEISQELVDPWLEKDPLRLFTVKARSTILREYLFKGGELYMMYPQNGLGKRTPEQQKIYLQALANYPAHLFDMPLKCAELPDGLSGALYLFEDFSGNRFVFAIKMTQAKESLERGQYGLWFGPLNASRVQKRVHALADFLLAQDVDLSGLGL